MITGLELVNACLDGGLTLRDIRECSVHLLFALVSARGKTHAEDDVREATQEDINKLASL